MPKKSPPKTAASKEVANDVSTVNSGTDTPKKEAKDSNITSKNPAIDLAKVVEKLKDSYATTPERLDKLIDAEDTHMKILKEIEESLSPINAILYPGKDAVKKGLAVKLSTVDRNKLMIEQTRLISLKRKLLKSNRIISVKLVSSAKDERKSIRFDDLRDKVKDPSYYKKYGKHIVPSFSKWIKSPMTKELADKLVKIKSSKPAEFNDALAKLLLMENPALYIKSTGSKELRLGFFAEFKKAMDKWQLKSVKIKN